MELKTRPRRQRLTIALFVAQLLTALAALIASGFEVETILVTGPLLVVIGLSLAVAARPLGTWAPVLFGLSGPLISAFIAFMIAAFHLDPTQAKWPIFAIFAIYLIVMVRMSMVTIRRIRQWHDRLSQPPAWRYSIKSLLGFMTVVAVLTAALASFVKTMYDFPVAFAAFGSAVTVLAGVVAWRFLIQRRQMPHSSRRPIQY